MNEESYLLLLPRYHCVLPGIGYILDPDFSFVKIAAPYAQVGYVLLARFHYSFSPNAFMVCIQLTDALHHLQELLDGRQRPRNGTRLVEEIRKQANDVLPSLLFLLDSIYSLEMLLDRNSCF